MVPQCQTLPHVGAHGVATIIASDLDIDIDIDATTTQHDLTTARLDANEFPKLGMLGMFATIGESLLRCAGATSAGIKMVRCAPQLLSYTSTMRRLILKRGSAAL